MGWLTEQKAELGLWDSIGVTGGGAPGSPENERDGRLNGGGERGSGLYGDKGGVDGLAGVPFLRASLGGAVVSGM